MHDLFQLPFFVRRGCIVRVYGCRPLQTLDNALVEVRTNPTENTWPLWLHLCREFYFVLDD
jgi:hypothetical protein